MYINRRIFMLKPDCMQDATQLVKEESQRVNVPATVQHPVFGQLARLTMDIPFKTFEHHEKFWGDWFAAESSKAFFEKWTPLVLEGGTNEWLRVILRSGGVTDPREFPLIERLTVSLKVGHALAFEELIQGIEGKFHVPFQLLTPVFGRFDRYIMDLHFQSMADRESKWHDWGQSEAGQTFVPQWSQMLAVGTLREMWQVV